MSRPVPELAPRPRSARPRSRPHTSSYSPARLHSLVEGGVRCGVYPGAVWAVGDSQGLRDLRATGLIDPARNDDPVRTNTVYDVASFTKILATWTSVGTLWERGLLNLDVPLGSYWTQVTGHPVGTLSARHLLTHMAGLPLRAQLKPLYGSNPAAARHGILAEKLRRAPGEAVEYTDRAAMILGFLTEDLTGQRLDTQAAPLWRSLGLTSTSYGPLPASRQAACAPTERDPDTGRRLQGSVHDYSARLLGPSCGSAGVFSHARDVGRFLAHLLEAAPSAGKHGVSPAWTRLSLQVHTGSHTPARGLLWHLAPNTQPRQDIWAHYGFTGTGMWICPRLDRWAVLLTNKIYYSRGREPLNRIRDAFRAQIFR